MKKKQSHRRKINKKKERFYKEKYGIEIKLMPPRQIVLKPKGRRVKITIGENLPDPKYLWLENKEK